MTIDPISLEIAKIVIKTVWEGGGKLFGWMGSTLNESKKNLIFKASDQYFKNYKERHCTLKVLGMREPVQLEDVYAAVQFLDEQGIRRFDSIESLEASYRSADNRRSFQSKACPKQDGLKVANDKQYLMVLGGPGAGKSTFLRRIGLEAFKGKKAGFKHSCIPVFIELKRFNTGEINVEKVIADELRNCGFPEPEASAKKLLAQGKLLILLDGLDEVTTERLDQAITQIQDFVDRYDTNRFIASCRIAARRNFRRFTDVAMAEFDDEQIRQFITNWFQSQQDKQVGTAQKCWELLQKPEYKAAKELAQTPLLLTLLCLVYDDSQAFPKNRAVLYGEALDVLLKKWAAEKRIQRDPIYQDLSVALEEMMLAEIAYIGFEADRLFFSQREVTEQITGFLASNLNAPKHLDGEVILQAIEVQQGVLAERAKDVFSFSHLTLQEYLTAQYIADNNQIEKLVTKHLTERRWQEVFLLVPGLMRGGADELLLMMEKQAQAYLNTPKLKALLQWADQATTNSEGTFKPAAKRTGAIFLALALDRARALALDRALALALDRARALALDRDLALALDLDRALALDRDLALALDLDRALDRARALDLDLARQFEKIKIFKAVNFVVLMARLEALKAKIPDDQQAIEVRRAFAEQILQTWLNALNLRRELVELSNEEITALENYFYANWLMVQCKEAAVRVSPKTWEGIEERMVRVVD